MEKPILFNTEMVRAILRGQKTQTRRIVKDPYFNPIISGDTKCRMPYQPGDILYVRETWYYESHMHELTDGKPDLPSGRYSHRYVYRADQPDYPVSVGVGADGWRPSIHMPKEAARIWLKVTNVRCERLQDISFADIQAEGMDMDEWYEYDEWQHSVGDEMGDKVPVIFETPYHFFGSRVWDSTMGSLEKYEKYGWDANPWVWVIKFDRIPRNQ